MRLTWTKHAGDVFPCALLAPGMGAIVVIIPWSLATFAMERSVESLAMSIYIWVAGIFGGYVFGTIPAAVGALLYITWLWRSPPRGSTGLRGAICGWCGFVLSVVPIAVAEGAILFGTSTGYIFLVVGLASVAGGFGAAFLRDVRVRAAGQATRKPVGWLWE